MKTVKIIKKYIIPSLCFLASTCFGELKTLNIGTETTYEIINNVLVTLANDDTIQLSITSDPNMEKTWYSLSSITQTGILLELTATNGAINGENLEYLTECLSSVSSNITLTKLNISNNDLASNNNFNDYISSCSGLTEIDISKNKNTFSTSLLDKLVAKTITCLKASECGLKIRNVEKILNLNTGIATLDLSKNNINSLSNNFATYLQKNTITSLDLSNNADLFKNSRSVVYLLKAIEGKTATVTLTGCNATPFMKVWIDAKKEESNTINF